MTTSIFLAKIFSLYFLIMAVLLLIKRKALQETFEALLSNKPLLFISAIISLLLGLILVLIHPSFTRDWRSLISLFAWLTLIKGVVYLFTPQKLIASKAKLMGFTATYYISGIVLILLALFLGYHGFIA